MENRKFTRDLYIPLTTEERDGFLSSLVELNAKHNKLENDKKSIVDDLNAQKKEVEADMSDIYYKVGRNQKLTEVEVEEYIDEITEQVIQKRLDTNQIIGVRKMVDSEFQRDLPIDIDEETIEREFQRDDDVMTDWLKNIEEKVGREVSNDEVLSWLPDQYRMVEDWVLLVEYATRNPDKQIVVGNMPEILQSPIDRATAETTDETPDVLGDEFVSENSDDGVLNLTEFTAFPIEKTEEGTRFVWVETADVPAKYKETSFDNESGVLSFFSDKRKKNYIKGVLITRMEFVENVEPVSEETNESSHTDESDESAAASN